MHLLPILLRMLQRTSAESTNLLCCHLVNRLETSPKLFFSSLKVGLSNKLLYSSTMDSRQEYIRAAVSFLQNPKLVDSSLNDKLNFLKDKGLSKVEVDEALNLALINRHQTQSGGWNYMLVLGLCIGGYKLYQAYMSQKETEKLEQAERPLSHRFSGSIKAEKASGSASTSHASQRDNEDVLSKIIELKRSLEHQRTSLQSEIQSIKTILLGHEKFAAPPKIPEWQLEKDDTGDGGESSKTLSA